jgi:predicted membrane protein
MDYDPIIALVSIIFGVLVIAFEGLLGWIVGVFFILLGIWFLIDYLNKSDKRKQYQKPK